MRGLKHHQPQKVPKMRLQHRHLKHSQAGQLEPRTTTRPLLSPPEEAAEATLQAVAVPRSGAALWGPARNSRVRLERAAATAVALGLLQQLLKPLWLL